MKNVNPYPSWNVCLTWIRRGTFGVADQISFSTANFLVNLLLLRWLSRDELGQFVLLYTVMLLGATIHTSVVVQPMVVFAPGRFSRHIRKYLGEVLIGFHLFLLAIAAFAAAVIAIAPWVPLEFGLVPLGSAILYATFTGRHACYVCKSPHLALGGSLIYTIVVLSCLVLLHSWNSLTGPRVFGILAIGGLAGTAFYATILRLSFPRWNRRRASLILRRHLLQGKWMLGATGITRSAGDFLVLFLGAIHGFGALAVLRAAETLILPIFQLIESVKNLTMPVLVKNRRSVAFRKQLLALGAVSSAMALVLSAFLIALYPLVNAQVFNGKYPEARPILIILSFAALVSAALGPAISGFRAMERTREIFWPQLRGTIAAFGAGLLLIYFLAETGAALTGILIIGLPGMLIGLSLLRALDQQAQPVPQNGRCRSSQGI